MADSGASHTKATVFSRLMMSRLSGDEVSTFIAFICERRGESRVRGSYVRVHDGHSALKLERRTHLPGFLEQKSRV